MVQLLLPSLCNAPGCYNYYFPASVTLLQCSWTLQLLLTGATALVAWGQGGDADQFGIADHCK